MKIIGNIIHNKHSHMEFFDKNGNLRYYETINGFWRKSEFDDNGNVLYCEYSDGYKEDMR